ncbi:amino acid/polyamine transporter I [Thelonectria olida]|uniref:Amino acid/polyamine transporter I n=1 Tax=Thelonectria olida TaxID=1576542 RepID=A0A9P9AJ67_9HYPO|nr:amino acid/polyamine transporter I [Thelonectria olida]
MAPDAVSADALELEAAGYRQAMPRRFSLWSLGALSFTLTCTWLGTGSSIGISLTESSSVGTLWSLPIAGAMTMIVSAGMAELASAYPVAGAQYYWSFMVARDDYKPFASYLNGWISVLGWWLASGSVSNFVSSMILDIVVAWQPDWEPQHWQQYLIYVALIWIATAINIFMAKWIPLFNQLIFVLSAVTLSATTITLFVVTKNPASASFIFTDATNRSGWSSDGFAFMLAVGNAVYSFLGSDCGAHMCEEIPNPAKNVPRVMLYPLLMGFLTAFPFAASLMYATSDISAVLNTATGLPLFEIYYQGTGSRPAASVLMALFAFCFFANLVANATTSSRTLWAVSRDGALPYSRFWERVHPCFEVPVNSLLLSATFITLYGLIFLGSSTAFSAMVSGAIIFLQTSCVIPQAVVLYRGRDRVLPPRYFRLGKYGALINGISVAWVVFLDVLYCFPTSMPVTPQNMSYVSVVCVGLVGFVITLWFTTKRGTFKGPKIDLEVLHARRVAAVEGNSYEITSGETKEEGKR